MTTIYPDGAIEAARLERRFGQSDADHVLAAALGAFDDQLALVSSFGAESAVLLDIAAKIDPSIQVLFMDTGKMFGETKRYRDQLIDHLGLTNVVTHSPPETVQDLDPKGDLWLKNPDACCAARKVAPLATALEPFKAWITGRKRGQSKTRANLTNFEWDGTHVKVNPLAGWSRADVLAYIEKHTLPQHPLVPEGFLSIGCMPCTARVEEGEDPRAGRWRGRDKLECGIHRAS